MTKVTDRLPAARALLRLAVRQTGAARRTTALVFALVGIPLALATTTLCMTQTLNPTSAERRVAEFGEADVRVYGALGDAAPELPDGTRVGVLSRAQRPIVADGTSVTVTVVEIGGDTDLVRSRNRLRSGRWPEGPDEVAATTAAADTFGARLEGTVVVDGRSRRVVALYDARRDALAEEIQLTGAGASVTESLVAAPPGQDPAELARSLRAAGVPIEVPDEGSQGSATDPAMLLAQWSVILIEMSLLVGAVFAVLREREARQATALSLIGAAPAHLAGVAVARAAMIGTAGVLVANTVGLAGAEAVRRLLSGRLAWVAEGTRVPVVELVVLDLLVVAAVVAAALLALRPRRIPSHAGRQAKGAVLAAVVLGAVGTAAVGVGSSAAEGGARALALSIGGAALVVAAALLGTELLFAAARPQRGPAAVRIALRDLARHRSRMQGIMVAGLAGLVGGTVAMAALSSVAARDESRYVPQLRADQVLLDGASRTRATALAAVVGDASVAPVATAVREEAGPAAVAAPTLVMLARPDGTQATAAVVDEADLHTFGIVQDASAPDGGWAYLLAEGAGDAGSAVLQAGGWRLRLPAREVRPLLAPDTPLPNVVVPRRLATASGLVPSPSTSWLLRAPGPLTSGDRAEIRRFTSQDPGLRPTLEPGYEDDNRSLRRALDAGLIGFGVLICVLVVVLAETERARTYEVLHALGASAGLRRSLALVTAATLSGCFVLLSVAVALPLAGAVLGETPLVTDVPTVALDGVLVVAFAVVAAWRSGSRPVLQKELAP